MMLKSFTDYSANKSNKEEVIEVDDLQYIEENKQEMQSVSDKEEKDDIELVDDETTEKEDDDIEKEEKSDKKSEKDEKDEEILEDMFINDPIEEKDEKLHITVKIDGKIATFSEGHIKDIYSYITENINEISFFIRKTNNQVHVVKYNEKLEIDVNRLVDGLFKHYSKNEGIRNIVSNIKIKGNNKFSVIENINTKFSDKVVVDLSKILNK